MTESNQATLDESTSEEAAAPATAQQRPAIEVNTDDTVATYANFCRVIGTPEELIVDFGVNSQPFGPGDQPVKIDQRIIVNYYTAKRLLGALSMSIQRHEQAFGVLETDINKRVERQ